MPEKPAEYEMEEDSISDTENDQEAPQSEPQDVRGETALTLYDQMAQEWEMKFEQLKPMVRVTSTTKTVDILMVERLVKASKRYGVPIGTLMEIRDKNDQLHLYFTADAIRWRVFTDPRGFESSTTEIVHMPDMSKEKDYVAVKATVTMKDGSKAEGLGISEWPPTKRNHNMPLGDLTMKMETKAKRRAGINLVGANIPVFDEDFYAWGQTEGKKAIESDYKVIRPEKPKKTEPDNIAELLNMVDEDQRADAVAAFNEPDFNVKQYWKEITSARVSDGEGREAEGEEA